MLAQALDRMEAGKFVPAEQKATIEALRVYVKSLRGIAADLLTHHKTFVSVQEQYRAALTTAPAKFRDASRLFLEYAAEEPFYEIKQDYERLAQDWLTLASLVERRAAEVARDDKTRDWGDTLRYVERTALFLERLDAHLESFPINLDSGEIRERHIADLKAYIDGFEALRKHLGTYREKLRNGAVSPGVRGELTTAARERTARTNPVAFVPPGPTPSRDQFADVSFSCTFLRSEDWPALAVRTTREFRPGEILILRNDHVDLYEIRVRNIVRTGNGQVVFAYEDGGIPAPWQQSSLTVRPKAPDRIKSAGPAEAPETYRCLVGLQRTNNFIGVLANREFAVGETYRLDVDGSEYATVVVLRTVARTEKGSVIEIDFTKPMPARPTSMVLVRLPSATPSDSPTLAARR